MDSWERSKIGLALTGAGTVLAFSSWFSGLVVSPRYPEQRGYAVAGVAPVDLAAAQRTWPITAARPGERSALLGYIRNIDKASLPTAAAAASDPPPSIVDLGTLLAAADPERGRRTAQVCASCHTFEPNGPNRIGPNLWGIVGRPVASHRGYAYSPALARFGGAWTYEVLDEFLASPARAMPGTKMTYAGLRNPRDRANLLAYLATASPNRPAFPAPAPSGIGGPPRSPIAP